MGCVIVLSDGMELAVGRVTTKKPDVTPDTDISRPCSTDQATLEKYLPSRKKFGSTIPKVDRYAPNYHYNLRPLRHDTSYGGGYPCWATRRINGFLPQAGNESTTGKAGPPHDGLWADYSTISGRKFMVVQVKPGQQLSGGALVSIQTLNDGQHVRQGNIYDRWEYLDDGRSQLKLAGTEYCLDASTGVPES